MNALLEELKGRQGELYHLQTRTLPVEFRSGKTGIDQEQRTRRSCAKGN